MAHESQNNDPNELPSGIFNISGSSAGSLLQFFTEDNEQNRFPLSKIGQQTGEGSGDATFANAFNRAHRILHDDAFSRAFGAFGSDLADQVITGLLFPEDVAFTRGGASPGPDIPRTRPFPR